VAKAELEGMIKGIEDKMTEFEISQIGTEAEKTELQRMMELLQDKMAELEDEKKKEIEKAKAKMEEMVKGVEDKMTELEVKVQGTQDKMEELGDEVEELEGEMEVRKLTIEYIQNLEDRGELETLCKEAGISCDGSEEDLRSRLLRYVGGMEMDSGVPGDTDDERFTREYIENIGTKVELQDLCQEAGLKKSGRKEELRERLLEYVREREVKRQTDPISPKHSFKLEGADKLVHAVMGDMYKHLSMELGDSVQEFAEELEIFIRTVMETREKLGMNQDDMLKCVVIKPHNDRTGEVLNKLKTEFLSKVKADDLNVVEPGTEWEGIKLIMDQNKDLIATTFKTQAPKVMMLLKLQSPQKIKQIFEEKGRYSLGVEGYIVTITPEMLSFRISTPDNFEIIELDNGIVYIDKEFTGAADEENEDIPEPEGLPEPEENEATIPKEVTPEYKIPEPSPPPKAQPSPSKKPYVMPEEELPPPPDWNPIPKPPQRKKKIGFLGKFKKRRNR
jgi:hypothetical protein